MDLAVVLHKWARGRRGQGLSVRQVPPIVLSLHGSLVDEHDHSIQSTHPPVRRLNPRIHARIQGGFVEEDG